MLGCALHSVCPSVTATLRALLPYANFSLAEDSETSAIHLIDTQHPSAILPAASAAHVLIALGNEATIHADITCALPISLSQINAALHKAALLYTQRPIALANNWRYEPVVKQLLHPSAASISFTDKEAQLFHALLHSTGNTLTREQLLRDVWGYDGDVDSHTLETHIYRLRQKCEVMGQAAPTIRASDSGYSLSTS